MTDSMERYHQALEEFDAKRAKLGHPPVDNLLRIHLVEFYSHGVYTGIDMYFERLQQSRKELETETATEIAPKA